MKGYGKYKRTDEFWLPQLPTHWSFQKVKRLFNERIEKGHPDKPLLAATQNKGVVLKKDYGSRTVEATKDLHLLKLVRSGDFVISLRSFQGGIEYAHVEGIISPAYTVMIPSLKVVPGYFKYFAKIPCFLDLLKVCVTGIREGQNIDYKKLREHFIPIPPREEQDQIVRYLDAKVSKINKLIRIKEKQIALLKEKKQAIINQAVTKGLDPNATMKDSGIAWIGQIPGRWEVERLKFLMDKIVDCPHETPHYSADGTYFVIRTADQDCGFLRDTEKMYRLNSQEYQHRIRREPLLKDDIVYGREGERWGLACLVPENNIFCLGQRMMQFRCNNKKILPKFAIWMLNAQYIYHQGTIDTMGSTSPHVNIETIKNYYCIFPCKSEQKYISKYITAISEYTESLIKNVVNEIAALTEYRTRLISDVVTGKIDVRGIPVTKESNKDQENATGVHQWLVQNGEGVYPVDEYDEDEQSE